MPCSFVFLGEEIKTSGCAHHLAAPAVPRGWSAVLDFRQNRQCLPAAHSNSFSPQTTRLGKALSCSKCVFPAVAGPVPCMSPRLPWSVSTTSRSSLSLFLTSISFLKLFLQIHINTFSPLPLKPGLEVIMKPSLSLAVTLLLPVRCCLGLSLLNHLPNSLYLLLVCVFHFPTNR